VVGNLAIAGFYCFDIESLSSISLILLLVGDRYVHKDRSEIGDCSEERRSVKVWSHCTSTQKPACAT
jgi:hypothetical protein